MGKWGEVDKEEKEDEEFPNATFLKTNTHISFIVYINQTNQVCSKLQNCNHVFAVNIHLDLSEK